MTPAKRFWLIEEVMVELRFDATAPSNPQQACREFLARKAIPVLRRGGRLLVEWATVEAALLRESGLA